VSKRGFGTVSDFVVAEADLPTVHAVTARQLRDYRKEHYRKETHWTTRGRQVLLTRAAAREMVAALVGRKQMRQGDEEGAQSAEKTPQEPSEGEQDAPRQEPPEDPLWLCRRPEAAPRGPARIAELEVARLPRPEGNPGVVEAFYEGRLVKIRCRADKVRKGQRMRCREIDERDRLWEPSL